MRISRSGRISVAMIVGAVFGALMFSGCTPDAVPDGTPSAAPISFTGQWKTSDDTGETRIAFDENGDFVGFDGCNTWNGSFSVSDANATLSFTSATEVACSKDVWLEKVTMAHIDGDSLVLTDSAGTQLGKLYKSES
ncbi:META domain-containing protein [Agreia bicolorata]|nr:META domain-containing protein [Agreia bicolorata]